MFALTEFQPPVVKKDTAQLPYSAIEIRPDSGKLTRPIVLKVGESIQMCGLMRKKDSGAGMIYIPGNLTPSQLDSLLRNCEAARRVYIKETPARLTHPTRKPL